MRGILSRYNTMKCQLQSMSGNLLGTQLQSKINFAYHEMLPTINKCQVRIIPRNVRYISYSNRYGWNKLSNHFYLHSKHT